ncbi:MAG: hypothetical protein KKD77_21860 [Gammaproteobacteria bacterium]|nr:hypothetical protein [Gammaproteobacteria bacterium]
MSTEKLIAIKAQIDQAKSKQSEIRGKRTSTEEQMQAKFKIKTIVAAEKDLKERASELDSMETEFEKGNSEIEAAYEWN